jgi:ribonuclease P protein subunit RPR2
LRGPDGRRVRSLALARISKLLDFAIKYYGEYPDFAVAAVRTAQRISMKYRVKLPTALKRKFCRKCYTPFTGASTFTVRIRSGRTRHVAVKCLKCGYVRRYQFRVKNKPPSEGSRVIGVGQHS